MDFKFGRYILQATSEQKPIKNFGEKGAWDCPIFLDTPYYLRNG